MCNHKSHLCRKIVKCYSPFLCFYLTSAVCNPRHSLLGQLSLSLLVTSSLNLRNCHVLWENNFGIHLKRDFYHIMKSHSAHFLSQIFFLDRLCSSEQWRWPLLACLCLKMDLTQMVYVFCS